MAKSRKLTTRDTLGVLIGRSGISVLEGGTGRSPLTVRAARMTFAEGEIRGILDDLMEQIESGNRVCVAIDPSLDFLSTRSVEGSSAASHADLVDELEERHGRRLLVEEAGINSLSQSHQTVFAAPRREFEEAVGAVCASGRTRLRIVSATHALYHLGVLRDPPPESTRAELRFFPGTHRSLAVYACGGQVLTRQILHTEDLDDKAIAVWLHVICTSAVEGAGLPTADRVVLHCGDRRPGLVAATAEAMDAEAVAASRLPLEDEFLCEALIHEAARRRGAEPGFFRDLVAAAGGGEARLLPKASMLLASGALLGVSGMLWWAATGIDNEIRAVEAGVSMWRESVENADALEVMLDGMRKNAVVVDSFLDERVYWTDVLSEVGNVIPEGVVLDRLHGLDRYQSPIFDGDEIIHDDPDASVELSFSVPVEADSARIPEVSALTDELRRSKLFQERFSEIPNAEVNVRQENGVQIARITIKCKEDR